ncbi:MAG TPA: tetratricopeptide repeat protein [Myxococcota bacterium]|nr:tetratricopeptide repeat protein [Myxococcota bacterium]
MTRPSRLALFVPFAPFLPLVVGLGGNAYAAPCATPEVALRNVAATKVGSWTDVAARLASERKVANEAEAIQAVCDVTIGCSETSLAFCTLDTEMACFVRSPAPGAPWYVLPDLLSRNEEGLTVNAKLSPDKAKLHVAISLEMLGRIEDAMCETAEDGSANCTSATGSYGFQYVDLGIDLGRMNLMWDAVFTDFDESASGETRCKKPHSIAFEGEAVVRTSCLGKAERFEVKQLEGCTVAARTAYLDAEQSAWTSSRRKAAEAKAKTASDLVEKGRKLTKAKDYDAAIKAFDEAIAVWGLTTAWSGRGYARLQRAEGADLDLAQRDFEEALALEPNDAKFRAAVMFNLGLLFELKKDKAQARDWFEKSHSQNPTAATRKKLGL